MLYFDTSCLLPLIIDEPTSNSIEEILLSQQRETLAISQWARVEVSSALARHVRMRKLTGAAARTLEVEFNGIVEESFLVLTPQAGDFELAREYLQHHDTGLRAGDALHLAVANNNGAVLYSHDNVMWKAGTRLGLDIRMIKP